MREKRIPPQLFASFSATRTGLFYHLKRCHPCQAFQDYTLQLKALEHHIKELKKNKYADSQVINLESEYHRLRIKYLEAYNDMLDAERHPSVNLSKPEHTAILLIVCPLQVGLKIPC